MKYHPQMMRTHHRLSESTNRESHLENLYQNMIEQKKVCDQYYEFTEHVVCATENN